MSIKSSKRPSRRTHPVSKHNPWDVMVGATESSTSILACDDQASRGHNDVGGDVAVPAVTEGYSRRIIASTAVAASGSGFDVTVCCRRGAEGSALLALPTPSAFTADAFPFPAASPRSPPLSLLAIFPLLRLHQQHKKIPTPNNNVDTSEITI